MKEELGTNLTINWRYFSLEQANSNKGPEWKIWDQPLDYPCRGLLAFCAAEAARRQGEAVFAFFHIAVFKARHERMMDIANREVIISIAETVNLDTSQFQRDLNDPRLLDTLARDHTFAVETLGVFGTPTFVFPKNQAVFLKMSPIPSPEDSLQVFNEVRVIAEGRPSIKEIKRP